MSDQGDEYGGPLGYVFAVGERPYCCWDYDHSNRALEFLDGLDTEYFDRIASILADRLDADDSMTASVALRVTYNQGIETLFSLLGATAQAPGAVPAWIASCTTEDLKQIVSGLRRGRSMLTQSGRAWLSLHGLSDFVHRFAWPTEEGPGSTAEQFGQFWDRLSSDFLDDTARAEYNALKHGSRVAPGGFTLAVGTKETAGVLAPPEDMRSLGGSRFGSTFFVAERVGESRQHIRTRRTSVNWEPLSLAQRLVLISMSINNVLGALRCGLGVAPAGVRFVRPDPRSAFDDLWSQEPSVRTTSMGAVIVIDPADELPKDELTRILEARGNPM